MTRGGHPTGRPQFSVRGSASTLARCTAEALLEGEFIVGSGWSGSSVSQVKVLGARAMSDAARRLVRRKAELAVVILAMAIGLLLGPATALAAVPATYVATSTIASGEKYLLVANVTNEAYGSMHNPAKTVLGCINMNSTFQGVQDFTVTGSILRPTSTLAAWEFAITSSGTSDNGHPGYWIKSGSSYLDLAQGLTGTFGAQSPPTALGVYTVSWREYVSQPYTYLSGTPRVWFWDGSTFYTKYTSDITSVGQYTNVNPSWPGYYTNNPTYGWCWVEWNTPWGGYGDNGDGTSQYGSKFTGIKFYLMGMRPGGDPVYPEGSFTAGSAFDVITNTQFYFGGHRAVAASADSSNLDSPGARFDLHATSFESKRIAL